MGTNVAFAAGTGVLCFIDLVAAVAHCCLNIRLRRSSLNTRDKMGSSLDSADFDMDDVKFHLYVSFPNREQSVALEFLEGLDAYCKRMNLDNFTLFLRLSQENVNPARWNETFIREEINNLGASEIKRVWVCGPPVMNETFDRVFSAAPARDAGQNGAATEDQALL